MLTDKRMPEMDGLSMIVALRRTHPYLPVVVATGFATDGTHQKLKEIGGPVSVLQKPFALDRVADELERLVHGGSNISGQQSL